ncbi:hypothetical protein [Rhizorhabdus sp.]|uniref:hypothetical protein n=1 Tax=Rhizorhabdus sp. TaxID=1968843 RepID=UPI001201F286|nr:hypothetical protein [Rhizorhabdus sp.]MBD3761416.1 hypothetical protein [Rhizorhabdus sp.]TAK08297.1 MAG: hypothetical protein EPO38_11470 [Rhizorhabdus sp.]
MFKLLVALALAAGSVTAAQANEPRRDHNPTPANEQLTTKMPHQTAGPVKIRLRMSDDAAYRLVMITPGANGELAYRLSGGESSAD